MKLPTLYKLTGRGNLQEWTIEADGNIIRTTHGQVGGKMQVGEDVVSKGKNAGKANATTPEQQAELEVQAKWTKKKDREGYLEDRARAEAGESDRGCIAPMLAHTYEDLNVKKRGYPYRMQRKLNGVRCLVKKTGKKIGLWSRKGKLITGVPHIQKAYEDLLADFAHDITLDGEIYRHGWSLQTISGFVRKAETKPGFEELGHHLYDFPISPTGGCERPWETREKELAKLHANWLQSPHTHLVETFEVADEAAKDALFKQFLTEEYEGGILRHPACPYEPDARSWGLLKVKVWKELEFPIVGVKEGRGKFAGKAIFECNTVVGRDVGAPQTFDCCAPGDFDDRTEALRNSAEIVGKKQLTVKFFEWSDEHKPVFVTGEAIRDYE